MLVKIVCFVFAISMSYSLETCENEVESCTLETVGESELESCTLPTCENEVDGCTHKSFLTYTLEYTEEKTKTKSLTWADTHLVEENHNFEDTMWKEGEIDKPYTPKESFDPRYNKSLLKRCPSIIEISDQGNCNSCWAIAATDVMTDRLCWNSKSGQNIRYSVQDLLDCCKDVYKTSIFKKDDYNDYRVPPVKECGDVEIDKMTNEKLRCNKGGDAEKAWKYWIRFGIVSGGFGNSTAGCKNYKTIPCNHMNRTAYETYSNEKAQKLYKNMKFCDDIRQKPVCSSETLQCDKGYDGDKNYTENLMRGESVTTYTLGPKSYDSIKKEIENNGSVHAIMKAYKSFLRYYPTEETYYEPEKGEQKDGLHSIRIIGWKTVHKTKCWIVANTYGKHWGNMEGFFYLPQNFNDGETVYAGNHRQE